MRITIMVLLFALAQSARADFIPIPLTPESYNQDMIVERTAPGPVMTVTSASMEGGTNNSGFSWYERGYNADSPSTGLPVASGTVTSDADMEHSFQFPPTYRTNNAVLLNSAVPTGNLVLASPAAFVGLSFLTSSGNAANQIAYTVSHADGTTEIGTFTSPNWLGPAGQAVTTYGRVDVRNFTFAGVHDANPRLYACDVPLTNTLSPVTRVDFTFVSGSGHTTIFALSAAVAPGEPFAPVLVAGFNHDLVVEASANRPGRIATATTATMTGGAANIGYTWYETGYVPSNPGTGLPVAGSSLTNGAAPDHRYILAPGYNGNNVVLVDAAGGEATISPTTPAAFATLSFLCAAAAGPVTNTCRVQHTDGSHEDALIVVPDWLTANGAFAAGGRINIDTRFPQFPAGGVPCLFSVDLTLTNTTSAVTSLALSCSGGAGPDPHTAIFALSGQTGGAVVRPRLTITVDAAGYLHLSATAAGTLESTTRLQGTDTAWHDEAVISSNLTLDPRTNAAAKWFRVRVPGS